MEALCRVIVRRDLKGGWTVLPGARKDGEGMHLAWVGGLVSYYLRNKRHPKTMHEVHLLLHGLMGSVPEEVEVAFDDYDVAPVQRSDMPHLTHRMNFGEMENQG